MDSCDAILEPLSSTNLPLASVSTVDRTGFLAAVLEKGFFFVPEIMTQLPL